jgi:spore germination protein GerM
MRSTRKKSSVSLGLILGVSTALITTGGVAAWLAFKSLNVDPNLVQTIPTTPDNPVGDFPSQTSKTVELYWLPSQSTDINLVPTPVTLDIKRGETSQQILTTALQLLLAGPETESYATTIPAKTELLNLTIKEDGIHLNLSQDFTLGGGSASMTGRLGQIIYTATTLQPNAAVWIEVQGKPLELLGGEGLMITQPMTRQDFRENFPLEATE